MPQPIPILLDHIEKIIVELHHAIRYRSFKKMEVEVEKLTPLLECLKSLFPKEFTEATFEHFDRHLHYVKHYIDERNLDMVKQNSDDIRERDLPNIKSKIYALPEGQRVVEKEIVTLSDKVFIVHGKSVKPIQELKAMLREFGLKPIVLHEQPSGSRTIIEKLEKYSDVGYAFVVLTPDDVGKLANDKQNLKQRARQNVVLEFGYFMGMLGRDRVCCLYKGDVELPSDMQGIVYIPFKESVNECCDTIAKELKAAGYEIKIPSKPKEFENRYWVDLGFWVEGEPERKEAKKLYRELTTGIEYLSNDVTEVGSLTFKTYDIEEAKEVVRGARRMVDEYKGSVLESEMDLDVIKDQFSITKQPQCPKCGKVGRFSDFHCSDCGTELEPKEYIDV